MNGTESSILASVSRLFGQGHRAPPDGSAATLTGAGTAPDRKRQLLDKISDFFIVNDLHIDGRRMMLVHDMLAGRDVWLGERFAKREQSGLMISEQWLEQLDLDHSQQSRSQLDQLIAEFDLQIRQFATNAVETRMAAEGYETKLAEAAAGELSCATTPQDLARLAHQMIQQTRDLAATMKASESHTRGLQQRLEQAKLASETDALTGLPNRRAFEEHFGHQIQSARKSGQPLCVAFCDIDNFKRVNDVHGHDAGDRVLKKVASELGELMSSRSFVSRHGGEEFVILFEQIGLEAAIAKLDKVRTRLGSTDLRNRDSGENIGCITFSAGIVDAMGFANPRNALSAADEAMYVAKKLGKNRIVTGAKSE
jgi:diguanylate cyclase